MRDLEGFWSSVWEFFEVQKKLELPVKRILQGASADTVASRDALADPQALDAFVAFAERGRSAAAAGPQPRP